MLQRAVLAEVDLSASAVLRQALNEYVERHGYDGVLAWFAEHGRQAWFSSHRYSRDHECGRRLGPDGPRGPG